MALPASARSHVVLDDLKAVFGARLEAFVTYAPGRVPQPSMAIVTSLDFGDLAACARCARRWHAEQVATPVVLTRGEFSRSLDAFPVEFGDIIAAHHTLFGEDPFAGLAVAPADLRRACETQVRSLLLHLREDYMEAGGRPAAIQALVVDSAPDFRALVSLLARLDGQRLSDRELTAWAAERLGLDARVVADVVHVAHQPERSGVDTVRLFPEYLAATERLARHVDEWQ